MTTTRLLLVDDDEFVRGALTRALDQTGAFSVVAARNGHEALDIVARHPVDALLTDLQMPAMDGLTLLGHLFERGVRLPVAVMTGQAIAPEVTRRLSDYGIAATFTKPVDVGTLADELQRCLDPDTVGRIRGITLFGLLQLLEVERKTAQVVVRSPQREGRLYFTDGTLVHAHAGRALGAEAVYEILAWADPAVEIFYKRRARQSTVTQPLQHLLMEAARQLDERAGSRGPELHASPRDQQPAGAALPRREGPASPAPPSAGEASIEPSVQRALAIAGSLAAMVVEVASGMALGGAGGDESLPLALAAALATDVVRAQMRGIAEMPLADTVDDIIVTLGRQYHLMCFPPGRQDVFLCVILEREHANLGMARHQLRAIARDLVM